MSTLSFTSAPNVVRSAENAVGLTEAQRMWRTAALALLSVRVIQGFIYWGGGSRRFIYAPSKLNPDAPTWMANKFQTAMPGALFGTDHLISFMLHHFWLLYAGVILFSAAELVVGAMLMAGALTRVAALVSIGFFRAADGDVRLAGRDLHRRMDHGRLQSRDGCNATAWRQRRLLDRQRPDPSQSRAGRKSLVSLDGGKPTIAAQGHCLS